MINFSKMFETQKGLTNHIEEMHPEIKLDPLKIEKMILALNVELGELANEVRCFKFWSNKPRSEQPIVLEEYVDGIHFILQLAIYIGYTPYEMEWPITGMDITQQFLEVYGSINALKQYKDCETLDDVLWDYVFLGSALGFEFEEIEKAYFAKNQINHERQQNGY